MSYCSAEWTHQQFPLYVVQGGQADLQQKVMSRLDFHSPLGFICVFIFTFTLLQQSVAYKNQMENSK